MRPGNNLTRIRYSFSRRSKAEPHIVKGNHLRSINRIISVHFLEAVVATLSESARSATEKPEVGRGHAIQCVETKNGQMATYEPIRPGAKQAEQSMVFASVSPLDNRDCFHAASVLTTFLIGSF